MCQDNSGSGEGRGQITRRDQERAGWATPAERQGHYDWGRPSERQRDQQRRDSGRDLGRPGRGTKGRRILFGRLPLPRLGLIGSVS